MFLKASSEGSEGFGEKVNNTHLCVSSFRLSGLGFKCLGLAGQAFENFFIYRPEIYVVWSCLGSGVSDINFGYVVLEIKRLRAFRPSDREEFGVYVVGSRPSIFGSRVHVMIDHNPKILESPPHPPASAVRILGPDSARETGSALTRQ